jgi:hypothetical protein
MKMPPPTAAVLLLADFRRVHGPLNVIRQLIQMLGQPVEHLAFSRIRCKVADQRRFNRIAPELLKRGLIVLHLRSPCWFRTLGCALLLLIGNQIFQYLGRP